MNSTIMASPSAAPSGSASGEAVGENKSFTFSEADLQFAGSAGILHSTGVLLTSSDFAELKEKIATFSSFDELAANFSSRVLTRGTMVIKTESADKAEDKRDAVVAECVSCSNVPTSGLTTEMLQEASVAVSMHRDGNWFERFSAYERRTRPVECALESIRAELAACHDPLSVKHAMQINVKNLTGEIVAKSSLEMVDLLGPGYYLCADEQGGPIICEKIALLALQPVVCRFQHELLRTILDNTGRPDLVPSIQVHDSHDLTLRVPLGRAKGTTLDVGGTLRPPLFEDGGNYKYDEQDVDLWLDIRSTDFCYGWTQGIQCDRAAPNTPDWGDFRDSVSICPKDPAAMLCGRTSMRTFHLTNRAVFASAAECAAAVKTIKDLQTAFGNEQEAVEAVIERCPEYYKTHRILRTPYEKLAFVLDMGGESWELERETLLFETIDWVNSEGYRSYHELDQQEVLHYAVYVSVKADTESEAGQEDKSAAGAGSERDS